MTINQEFEEERGDPPAALELRPPFPIGVTEPQLPGENFQPGSPPAEVVVFSNFDVRPLDAVDFMHFCGTLSS